MKILLIVDNKILKNKIIPIILSTQGYTLQYFKLSRNKILGGNKKTLRSLVLSDTFSNAFRNIKSCQLLNDLPH
jgi:hypothetical protein